MTIDPKTIGQDQAVQDPQDAIEAAEGKYEDAAEKLSPTEKIDYMPKAPDPKPFTVTGGGGGA
jgi:hypothetical protein